MGFGAANGILAAEGRNGAVALSAGSTTIAQALLRLL